MYCQLISHLNLKLPSPTSSWATTVQIYSETRNLIIKVFCSIIISSTKPTSDKSIIHFSRFLNSSLFSTREHESNAPKDNKNPSINLCGKKLQLGLILITEKKLCWGNDSVEKTENSLSLNGELPTKLFIINSVLNYKWKKWEKGGKFLSFTSIRDSTLNV